MLKMIEPIVDFSLLKINTTGKFRVNIENTSPIAGEVLIKPFKHSHINFDNYLTYLDDIKVTSTIEGNLIKIDKPTFVVPAFSTNEFLISMDVIRQE